MNNQPDNSNPSKDDFLHPVGRYYGKFTPENLAFNSNLQEFASRVSLICGLETGGKISTDEAYTEIKALWKHLKGSKRQLLDQPPPEIEYPDE